MWHWLAHSPEAQAWLQALTASPPDADQLLPTLERLRAHVSPEQARALLTQARLRVQARGKFGEMAERMFFASPWLEQATPWPVARWTAQRYASASWVVDLGCGLGGDTLALAQAGPRVLAVDRDPVAVTLVRLNARAWGLSETVYPVRADIRARAWDWPMAWADPARRDARGRVFHPEALQPPLSQLMAWQRRCIPHLGIKLMPGLDHAHIPPQAEAEWISLQGQLKTLVLWFGDLAQRPGARRATILPAGLSLWAQGARAPVRDPDAYLYEPDPAVIRAGAVGDLAQALGLWQMDPHIAYLTGPRRKVTPWARAWPIVEHGPFHLKTLNRRLRARRARVMAVKKRGVPVEPEAFRRRLAHTPDGDPIVVVLTRVRDRPWMLLCGPLER